MLRYSLTLLLFSLLLVAPLSAQNIVALSGGKATLECFDAPNAEAVVIVCPGGSYCWLDYTTEGTLVARWLQDNGISAYVLRYRVAGWWAWFTHYRILFRGHSFPDPLRDVEAAYDWVWNHAESLHIPFERIGVMGFSAGGHLAMLSTYTRHPAFVAAIYPVVTMRRDYTHTRSRRALLGERHICDLEMRDSLSLELHIDANCPPVFLVNCIDDPIVDYRNSVLLDSALAANNIPHLYIQYSTGGHGFGASETKGSSQSRQWRKQFIDWLHKTIID